MLQAISHVVRFEFARSLTVARICIWLALCLFPAVLVTTLRIQSNGNVPDTGMIMTCYALVPQISCMLGLLLWATPAIGSELDAQTWIHLLMRPQGRIAVALGKYTVAVLWVASYSVVSALLVSFLSGVDNALQVATAMVALAVLASASYAALYLLIGSALFRRATVVAVVYSLALEGFVSWIPATINQATISFRLRTLVADWTSAGELREVAEDSILFGTEPSWMTILILAGYTVIALGLACHIIRTREYPIQSDS